MGLHIALLQLGLSLAAVVDYYRSRWTIEEFFKALKNGDDGQSGPARAAVVDRANQLEAPFRPAKSLALGPLATNGRGRR
jgi:hypothetical protein